MIASRAGTLTDLLERALPLERRENGGDGYGECAHQHCLNSISETACIGSQRCGPDEPEQRNPDETRRSQQAPPAQLVRRWAEARTAESLACDHGAANYEEEQHTEGERRDPRRRRFDEEDQTETDSDLDTTGSSPMPVVHRPYEPEPEHRDGRAPWPDHFVGTRQYQHEPESTSSYESEARHPIFTTKGSKYMASTARSHATSR